MRKIAGKWYPKGTEYEGEDRVVEVSFDGDMMFINIINEGVLKVIDVDMLKCFAWSGIED